VLRKVRNIDPLIFFHPPSSFCICVLYQQIKGKFSFIGVDYKTMPKTEEK